MDAERCVCCGEVIPEGRMVCYGCERGGVWNDNVDNRNCNRWYDWDADNGNVSDSKRERKGG